jgi:hypothetical protein
MRDFFLEILIRSVDDARVSLKGAIKKMDKAFVYRNDAKRAFWEIRSCFCLYCYD